MKDEFYFDAGAQDGMRFILDGAGFTEGPDYYFSNRLFFFNKALEESIMGAIAEQLKKSEIPES
jgi:hypothetical protein